MMRALLLFLFSLSAFATESFKIQLYDRKLRVEAPSVVGKQYAVIVENLSLSDVMGKFHAAGKDLKFVKIKAGQSKALEFEAVKGKPVFFQSMVPAFQTVELVAGKKSYEIPPQP